MGKSVPWIARAVRDRCVGNTQLVGGSVSSSLSHCAPGMFVFLGDTSRVKLLSTDFHLLDIEIDIIQTL